MESMEIQPKLKMNEIPRFEIISTLGHGQFSDVFKARLITQTLPISSLPVCEGDTYSDGRASAIADGAKISLAVEEDRDKYVAVKRIKFDQIQHSDERSDCYKEVKLLQRLSHENVIKYHMSFIEGPVLYIVLEYAGGGDLSKLIRYFQKRNEHINERTILKYFTQVCSAVQYIHSERILHRDIKPANIFMTSDGCVKLGDFGLGRFFSQNTRDAQTMVGTFYYMSPERIKESGYSFSSDVWSLGCVLYEMITFESPFSLYHAHQTRGSLGTNDVNNNINGRSKNTIGGRDPGVACSQTISKSNRNQQQHQQQPQQTHLNLQWLVDRILSADYPPLDNFTNISPRLRQLAHDCLVTNPNARPDMNYICTIVNRIYDYQQQVAAASAAAIRSQLQHGTTGNK